MAAGVGGGGGVVTAVLVMQCCNAVMAARLLEGELGSWLQGEGGVAGGELILQVLKGGSESGPNPCTRSPSAGGGAGRCRP
uniref:Uncharacterized protein n=1 Tax=Oryza brachyantha TaxID=4533 RepID=J3LKA7_ORYBR